MFITNGVNARIGRRDGALLRVGGANPLAAYAANGVQPLWVFSPSAGFYYKSAAEATLADLITFSASGSLISVDDAGVQKWAPHNLYPEGVVAVTSITLSGDRTSAAGATATENVGTNARYRIREYLSAPGGINYTFEGEFKYGARRYIIVKGNSYQTDEAVFDIQNGALGTTFWGVSRSITDQGSGWYLCRNTAAYNFPNFFQIQAATVDSEDSTYTSVGGTVAFYYRYPRVYRADLPMLDNPNTGNSYVPDLANPTYMMLNVPAATYDVRGVDDGGTTDLQDQVISGGYLPTGVNDNVQWVAGYPTGTL